MWTHIARHLSVFREDAARWVQPEQVADASTLRVGKVLVLMYRYMSLRAIAWYRLAALARKIGIPGVPGIIQRRMLRHYGLEMTPSRVGGGLYIAHPVGCTITAESIGRNVTIIGSVTIGYRHGARWPRIGDGVYIGTGARVLGDIDIGEGARIGANAVVLADVAAGTTALGVPATTR